MNRSVINECDEKQVIGDLRKIAAKMPTGSSFVVHLPEILAIAPQSSYEQWKQAAAEKERFYQNHSADFPYADASAQLIKKLKTIFGSRDRWQRLLRCLGAIHVQPEVQDLARIYGGKAGKTPPPAEVQLLVKQLRDVIGVPDPVELLTELFGKFGLRMPEEGADTSDSSDGFELKKETAARCRAEARAEEAQRTAKAEMEARRSAEAQAKEAQRLTRAETEARRSAEAKAEEAQRLIRAETAARRSAEARAEAAQRLAKEQVEGRRLAEVCTEKAERLADKSRRLASTCLLTAAVSIGGVGTLGYLLVHQKPVIVTKNVPVPIIDGPKYLRQRCKALFQGAAGDPANRIVSTGTTLLRGTFCFDLDKGTETSTKQGADIWWQQVTPVVRQITPMNNARVAYLGAVDFNAITEGALTRVTYSPLPLRGNDDATNQLLPHTMFAVHTDQGNQAKVQVVAYGYDMEIRWITYRHRGELNASEHEDTLSENAATPKR